MKSKVPSQGYKPFERSTLEDKVSFLLGKKTSVVITDNTRSMISFKKTGNGYSLRLHHMFENAGEDVLKALVDYIQSRSTGSSQVIDRFVRENAGKIRKPDSKGKRRILLRPYGQCYNLEEIYKELNARYFQKSVHAFITWGRYRSRRNQRHIRYGSYCERTNVIRINPILDRASVPRYVVKGVVYHEMLHAHLGISRINGRRRVHSPEFREIEKRYEEYNQWMKWEKERSLKR